MQHLLFERHVESFIDTFQKVPLKLQNQSIGLAVSGGADSTALTLVAAHLKNKYPKLNFIVLHFNHQSRPKENDFEQNFVQRLCQQFHFQLITEKNTTQKHGEIHWRKQRQTFFHQSAIKYNLVQIWLAHHLDDSFEWSLMQQAKSGNLKSTLGIPVKNGIIFRPFLSVTKNHILHYLNFKRQKFVEDSSNLNTDFERNWWRKHIIKPLKERYPTILKHYAHRAFDAALKLNLIYLQTRPGQLFKLSQQTHLFYLPPHSKILHSKNLLKTSLHELSLKDRMKISSQLKSLVLAFENRKKGPIYFSGGVRAYLKKNVVILTSEKTFNNDILNDSTIQQILKAHSIDQ